MIHVCEHCHDGMETYNRAEAIRFYLCINCDRIESELVTTADYVNYYSKNLAVLMYILKLKSKEYREEIEKIEFLEGDVTIDKIKTLFDITQRNWLQFVTASCHLYSMTNTGTMAHYGVIYHHIELIRERINQLQEMIEG